MNVGILHPGEMGSSIGAALVAAGSRVLWVRTGRSDDTLSRATDDGLEATTSLEELAKRVDLIMSVCPPHAALDQARIVVEAGFSGIYIDANAVAPETVKEIGSLLGPDIEFVDGGIIGPPARQAGNTRLYLSGARAEAISALFEGSLLQACPLAGGPGAASALKMCYAAWTKGSAALLMAVAALARGEGVDAALEKEWQLSQPELSALLDKTLLSSAAKAWRFSGEMEEIAATFRRGDLPDGFHLAAAEIYRRMTDLKGQPSLDSDTILKTLVAEGPG